MISLMVDILPEKNGVTRARIRSRDRNDETREAIDALMNAIMGKYPKRARFTDSTTVLLEVMTGEESDSSN